MEDLEEMKVMLSELIEDNADAIEALTTRVETNEGDIDTLEGLVEDNAEAIDTLESTVMTNADAIEALQDTEFPGLMGTIENFSATLLIEDFFFVNAEALPNFVRNTEANLIDPFCITEPGVLIFNLAVNYTSLSNRTPNIRTMLFIDGTEVA